MKKIYLWIGIIILLLVVGAYSFLKMDAPLVANQSAFSEEGNVQLITLGNKRSFGDIHIEEVRVNNNLLPERVKIQVSYHPKGFIISDDFEGEENYTFLDINSVPIETNTHPEESQTGEKEMEDSPIYALTLGHEEEINHVIIQYHHLGIPHEKEIILGF